MKDKEINITLCNGGGTYCIICESELCKVPRHKEILEAIEKVCSLKIKQAQEEAYRKCKLWLEEHKFCEKYHKIKVKDTDSYFEENCLMQVWKKCNKQLKEKQK